MTILNEYEWQNRSEEGLELQVDGHNREWDYESGVYDETRAVIYKTNEEEHEPDLEQ